MSTGQSGAGQFNTLAQNGTVQKRETAIIVQGRGADLSVGKGLRGRAKRKLISQRLVLNLLDLNSENSTNKKEKSYWNTYHCQSRIITADGRLYGRYCKNRFCTLCSAIRKADIINRYLPTVKKWEDPYFVTLTVKAVPHNMLKAVMQSMLKEFREITGAYRKRSQRKTGEKLVGLRALESNFNPRKKTYNPHIHAIVSNKWMAETLIEEWLKRSNKKWTNRLAQKAIRVNDSEKALVEVVKYGSKIFTEPDLNNGAKVKGNSKIYVLALGNIFTAMKGLRIFERFGFNLPTTKLIIEEPRVTTNYKEWNFDISKFDWINSLGERLVNYLPAPELLRLLEDNSDFCAQ